MNTITSKLIAWLSLAVACNVYGFDAEQNQYQELKTRFNANPKQYNSDITNKLKFLEDMISQTTFTFGVHGSCSLGSAAQCEQMTQKWRKDKQDWVNKERQLVQDTMAKNSNTTAKTPDTKATTPKIGKVKQSNP